MGQPAKDCALFFHALGANVLAIRTGEKKPAHPWKEFQTGRQTPQAVTALPWAVSDRVGIVNGPAGLRSFDFDKCPSWEPIHTLLAALELPDDYPWVEQSGSGVGWHVWVICTDLLPNGLLTPKEGERGVYIGTSQNNAFERMELRWEHNQTIIASSDGLSRWLKTAPTTTPATVSAGAVLNAFFAVAVRPSIPTRAPKAAGANGNERGAIDTVRGQFDLAAYALAALGGKEQYESNGEIRILTNGGLLIDPKRGVWFRHAGGQGGDCFDLVGFVRYGDQWDRKNKSMFRAVLDEAAHWTGTPTEPIRVHKERPLLHAVPPPETGEDAPVLTTKETELSRWEQFVSRRQSVWDVIVNGVPPIQYLVKPHLLEEKVTIIAGGPEQGKSWIMCHSILQTLRSGRRVMVLDEEEGVKGVAAKMEALGLAQDDDSRLFYFPFTLAGSGLEEMSATILEGVLREGISLVTVDSLSKLFVAFGLDENSNTDASRLMATFITPLAHVYGCAFLGLDHTTKVEDDSRYGRGAGSKLADTDVQWHIAAPVAPTRVSRGRIVMTKKKDRTATVPASIKWIAGGDGSGTFFLDVEESSFVEPVRIHRADVKYVAALHAETNVGKRYSDWMAAVGGAESSFKDARRRLIASGAVILEGDTYRVTSSGIAGYSLEVARGEGGREGDDALSVPRQTEGAGLGKAPVGGQPNPSPMARPDHSALATPTDVEIENEEDDDGPLF